MQNKLLNAADEVHDSRRDMLENVDRLAQAKARQMVLRGCAATSTGRMPIVGGRRASLCSS
jgi:hypothetical protein